MSELTEIKQLIEASCKEYSLFLEERGSGSFKVFTDEASGISLILNVSDLSDFNYYFLVRTHDVVYQGDRSDAHVILSLVFSSFLRIHNRAVSCSLFDIGHPVIENEIWGRYIVPIQDPRTSGISTWDHLKVTVSEIIELMALWREAFWHFASCPCDECCKVNGIDNNREYEIPQEIIDSVEKTFGSSSRINIGKRVRPNWSYLYDIENEVTIIKSDELSSYFKAIERGRARGSEEVDGINGKLIVDGDLLNFLSTKSTKEFKKLLQALHATSKSVNFTVIPLENMIVTVVSPYIIALGRLSGLHEFKAEREVVRQRHNRESEILFPVPQFEWESEINPDQFEALIKILLEREHSVKSVRRASPVNEGDKGRDLIIEWNVIDSNILSETIPPFRLIKVVGQCKASHKTIGKNKVLDIRDTVETHGASGFFLAVSSQISASMTEKLEALRANGMWTQWWNRDDIEMRVSKNQDLLPLFPKVLKAKHTIKFVEK